MADGQCPLRQAVWCHRVVKTVGYMGLKPNALNSKWLNLRETKEDL